MSGPESFETARDAANANPAPASAATVPVLWIDRNGVALPPSETTGVNEAADNLTAFRNSARDSAAKSISSEFAAAIDRMRAEGVTIAEDPNAPALPVPA